MQSSDEFMAHARHMDRRWERMLQHHQTQNQELQKNMVALASQMKGLEEEAMKKLHVQQPYSLLPPPLSVPRSPPAGTEMLINPGASPKVPTKEGSESDAKTEKETLVESTDGSTGAAKPDTEEKYGTCRTETGIHTWNTKKCS